jgi:hypothetical protein
MFFPGPVDSMLVTCQQFTVPMNVVESSSNTRLPTAASDGAHPDPLESSIVPASS